MPRKAFVLENFVVDDPALKAELEAKMRDAVKDDPFIKKTAKKLEILPTEEYAPPLPEDTYDLKEILGNIPEIEAVDAEEPGPPYVAQDPEDWATVKNVAPAKEYTGKSVSYYQVEVTHPTTEGRPTYIAECNDIIEALGMNFAEGNAFKAIWRSCAARRLGKSKQGYKDGVYDAEKVVFFGERMIVQAKRGE